MSNYGIMRNMRKKGGIHMEKENRMNSDRPRKDGSKEAEDAQRYVEIWMDGLRQIHPEKIISKEEIKRKIEMDIQNTKHSMQHRVDLLREEREKEKRLEQEKIDLAKKLEEEKKKAEEISPQEQEEKESIEEQKEEKTDAAIVLEEREEKNSPEKLKKEMKETTVELKETAEDSKNSPEEMPIEIKEVTIKPEDGTEETAISKEPEEEENSSEEMRIEIKETTEKTEEKEGSEKLKEESEEAQNAIRQQEKLKEDIELMKELERKNVISKTMRYRLQIMKRARSNLDTIYEQVLQRELPINYFSVMHFSSEEQVTDNMVEKRYHEILEQYQKNYIQLLTARDRDVKVQTQKRRKIERQIENLQDAYQALKTENGRKHVREMVKELTEYKKEKMEKNHIGGERE